ncbi:MAG: 30S ribosome-binding factor RbfA [Anaerolineales bacterium]|nr:30S ribosome-binding factor RbfA [Anaerolineales bacterium]
MVSTQRVQRIADRIQEELSEMMLFDVNDPRLEGVSITDVSVDRELAFADIYVSAIEGSQRSEEILNGFERASGFLRSELAKRVKLRIFPQLRFHWDPTFERGDRIDKLIASLQGSPHTNPEETPPSSSNDSTNRENEEFQDG